MKKIELLNKKKKIEEEIKNKENYLSRLNIIHNKLLERLINEKIKKEFGNKYFFENKNLKLLENNEEISLIEINILYDYINLNLNYFIFNNNYKLDALILAGKIAEKIKEENFLYEAIEKLKNQERKYKERKKKFNIPKLKNKLNEIKEKIKENYIENYIKENLEYKFENVVYDRDISSYYNLKSLKILKTTPKMAKCKFLFSNNNYVVLRKSKNNIYNLIKKGKLSKLDKRKIILNQL